MQHWDRLGGMTRPGSLLGVSGGDAKVKRALPGDTHHGDRASTGLPRCVVDEIASLGGLSQAPDVVRVSESIAVTVRRDYGPRVLIRNSPSQLVIAE